MKNIIAIDSGATKSQVLVIDNYGRKTFGKHESVNPNVLGIDESIRRLEKIISDCKSKFIFGTDLIASAGVSGTGDKKLRNKIQNELREITSVEKILISPDVEAAFASVFGPDEKNCGILISGTGAVLYYRDYKGKTSKTGGWGRIIGDEGSAFWIAREALSAVCAYYDGRAEKTMLAGILQKKYNLKKELIVKKIYRDGFEISKITPEVFKCASEKDMVSLDIIKRAAEKLQQHFVPLKRKKYRIALSGSLFTEQTLLEKHLRLLLKNKYPNIQLIKSSAEQVWGALKLGISKFKINGK